jgi:hypothetical protein
MNFWWLSEITFICRDLHPWNERAVCDPIESSRMSIWIKTNHNFRKLWLWHSINQVRWMLWILQNVFYSCADLFLHEWSQGWFLQRRCEETPWRHPRTQTNHVSYRSTVTKQTLWSGEYRLIFRSNISKLNLLQLIWKHPLKQVEIFVIESWHP